MTSPTAPPQAESQATPPDSEKAPPAFPIVGIGASAGGLEAFEQFFHHVPADSGMAFVLVPHLDPSHASILTEILQRATTMGVTEAQDQMKVEPNAVYVIPPNRDMAIFHGVLQLNVPEMPRGRRMPIDAFLRSLAEDQGKWAVGIILSGTGTDGTLGLRAILGAGGISLVQEPATAKFDGMPSSAIHAGYATHVLPVEKMAEVLLTGMHTLAAHPELPEAPSAAAGSARILMLLRAATGHDFSLYKKSTIRRRIERRMSQHDIADTEIYARYLREHPAEMQQLFGELLINVTSFFRDPEAFAELKKEILPQLCADKPEDYVFRVWVAGCSSGEEAYSLAILLREFAEPVRPDFRIQIYATDLDAAAIAIARAGLYPPNIVQDVSPERLQRFFAKDQSGYRVRKEIREMVVFAVHNVIKDPPFTRLDLLSCRNLMIYLESELQNRLIPAFHYALKPDGVLMLSPSESIGNHTDLFTVISRKWKFYRAIRSVAAKRAAMAGASSWIAPAGKPPEAAAAKAKEANIGDVVRRVLVQYFVPASVVTEAQGNIVYVHGDTGRYLRPAPGHASVNVVDMAREGLQLELRAALHEVALQGVPILGREATMKTGEEFDTVSFSVRPFLGPEPGDGLLLVSFDAAEREPGKATRRRRSKRVSAAVELTRIEELERDLLYPKENLQATIEEQQATNEELKSTNEEMQSTNEELQSTNEELETSKEELQSINEELITVNAELQAKIEQLDGMQNDLKNLMDNISVGTVFLDQRLVIRRFTREAVCVYRLAASDVGRALADIKPNIEGDDLLADAAAVLETLVPCERQVRTVDGASYLARIQPYRTLDNVIEGVVMTFTDISQRIKAEAASEAARELAEGIVNTVREPLVVLDGAFRVVQASRSFYRDFHVTPDVTVGRSIYELGNRQWDIPALRALLDNLLPADKGFDDYVVEHDFPVIGRRRMLLNARRIITAAGVTRLILLAMEQVA